MQCSITVNRRRLRNFPEVAETGNEMSASAYTRRCGGQSMPAPPRRIGFTGVARYEKIESAHRTVTGKSKAHAVMFEYLSVNWPLNRSHALRSMIAFVYHLYLKFVSVLMFIILKQSVAKMYMESDRLRIVRACGYLRKWNTTTSIAVTG